MRILLALIPISLALLGVAVAFFAWAVRNNQFEDLESAALDVLTDDTRPAPPIASAAPDTGATASAQAPPGSDDRAA